MAISTGSIVVVLVAAEPLEPRLDQDQVAEEALIQGGADLLRHVGVALLEVDRQQDLLPVADLDELVDRLERDVQRLGGDDMFAGPGSGDAHLGVHARGGQDDDRVDVIAFEDFVVGGHARHLELLAAALQSLLVNVAQQGQLGASHLLALLGPDAAHAQPDDRETNRFVWHGNSYCL